MFDAVTPKSSKAFSIIELIFVIVLIGIMANIGLSFMPDNRLMNDTNFLIMKIKETQRGAIGYDVNSFGSTPWSNSNSINCIKIDKSSIENSDKNSTKPHRISSDIKTSSKLNDHRLCFDEYGRPYVENEQELLKNKLDINLTLDNITKELLVMPMSGYVIIKRTN